ncbi:MAG: class I SAM-dependent methyltransferase [Rhodovibrionaceae bacterium]
MTNAMASKNLLFQSEQHPLVSQYFDKPETYLLSLIHRRAYGRASDLAEGKEVLDLGCNNGYGTAILAERALKVCGVDVSHSAVEAARSRHAAANIDYKVVDGGSLPFSDDSFDLVTSFQVIEHVDNVDSYLREISRVLRKDGHAVFTTPNRCIRLRKGQRPWNPFHLREYEASELATTLCAVFSKVAVEGLFAPPQLQAIEERRVARARRAGRSGLALLRAVRLAMRRVTPARSGMQKTPEELRSFMTQWTTEDLFYLDEGMDRALDLIAICQR